MRSFFKRLISALPSPLVNALLASWFLVSGCGKAPTAADNAGARMTGASKTSTSPSSQTSGALTPKSNLYLSVFNTDDPRDPFHPSSRSKAAATAAVAGVDAETDVSQLITSVQSGFQGIFGSPEARELMVHGVLLRENARGTIVVPVNGKNRQVKVQATRIYRNAAELKIEGIAQTVTIPKLTTK